MESMKATKRISLCVLVGFVLCALPAPAGVEAYKAMGIDKGKVINATQTSARLGP